jgi:hypothetical protein
MKEVEKIAMDICNQECNSCKECMARKGVKICYSRQVALNLQNKGYIKKHDIIKEIIEKVDDMIGGKMIATALREIYEVE